MKAAVCYELGKPLVIEEIDIDEPHDGEVKVRLVATAICHSDVHAIRGDWGGEVPFVAGHEAAGIVEKIGENVTRIKPGERVVVSLLRSCQQCFYCTTGVPHLCTHEFALDRETRLVNKRGEPIRHGIKTAAFAEYTIVHQTQVVKMPEDMPLDAAALLACGVITGLGAVVNTAKVEPARSVVVIGVGGVGLNSIQGAVLVGAHPIIAIDLLDNKLTAARSFGATHTINSTQNDTLAETVRELTSGRGADYVFVTVGSTAAVAQGLELIGKQGTEVLVGIPETGGTVPLPIGQMIFGERRIVGSPMGSTHLSVDVPRLVKLYQHKRLKLDELITARFPLEQINEAIESMERGEALRNVIMF